MALGYCESVLLLSLLVFSMHARALTYRSSSSTGIKPYFGMAEGFLHDYNSASRYEGSAQPGSSLGIYGPEHGSPKNPYPTATGMHSGPGTSHGSYINGYLQQGSASSYRPGSLSSSRPRHPHRQSHYQGKSDDVLQPKDAKPKWDFALPQKENGLEMGGGSSYAIEPQQPSDEAKHQPWPRPLPQQLTYEASKTQPRPLPQQLSYEPKHQPGPPPQQPSYEPKHQPRPWPQQPSSEACKPRPQPKPLPQQLSYQVSKPRPLPQQSNSEACKSRPQPRPLPQQSSYEDSNPPSAGVLQTKAAIWDLGINSNAGPRSFRPLPVASGYQYRWPHHVAPFHHRYQP